MFLGIDLGTSALKAVLLSDRGAIAGSVSHPLTLSRPKPGWVEQSPDEWWRVTCSALATLRDNYPVAYSRIHAIGLSGQMHGAVMLSRDDTVIRPAILWNDMRCVTECEELLQRAPMLHDLTGNWAMPGFTAPKLLWVAKHEPDNFRKLACVLLPKDYLRLRLTGERLTDTSDASGTLLLDVVHRAWSDELLDACDLTRKQVPAIVEGSSRAGVVRPQIASDLGLSNRVIVAAGGGDTATSAMGVGAAESGEGFLSLGTSGVLSMITGQARVRSEISVHTLCHALPDRWHRTSVTLSAASCLRWFCQLTSTDETTLLEEISRLDADACAQAPVFLPYLSGERTPHNDPNAQGVLFGLGDGNNRAMLGYSILEGVAFSIRDGFDALRADGIRDTNLVLVGGGARSRYWSQLVADVLDAPLTRQTDAQCVAAVGAARLGWLAAQGDLQTVMQKLAVLDEFLPDAKRHSALLERHDKFRNLYPQLKSLFNARSPAQDSQSRAGFLRSDGESGIPTGIHDRVAAEAPRRGF